MPFGTNLKGITKASWKQKEQFKNMQKTSTKEVLFNKFCETLETANIGFTEAKRRQLAQDITTEAMKIFLERNRSIASLRDEATLELEQHKMQFRAHIKHLEMGVKTLMDTYIKNGLVKYEKKGSQAAVAVPKTQMVQELMVFINQLNGDIADFYDNVYQIESPAQSKLFQ